MFPNKIEDLTDGATDHDYDLLFIEGRKSTRKDIASTQAEPGYLSIAHTETGTGDNLMLNSVARIDKTSVNSDGVKAVCSAYIVIRNPLQVFSAAEVLEVVKQLSDLLATGTNAAQLINGEI
jgi:hypothetical protein